MSRGGGKISKDWLDVDFTSPDAVTAEVLPYDSSSYITIKEKIDSLGGGGSTREIEYFTLSATDITRKYVTLTKICIDLEINFTVIAGPAQRYTVDFVKKPPNRISWAAADCDVGLEHLLRIGDVLQIEYSTDT